MSRIAAYLLSVLSAAVICAILKHLFQKKDGVSSVIHLLAGIFLTVTVIRPIISVTPTDLSWDMGDYSSEAAAIIEDGEEHAQSAVKTFIKEQTEAYILNEAKKLQLDVTVEVRLNDGNPPLPAEVTVYGTVSPYAKSYLTRLLTNDLGIAKENQLWIG